MYVGDYVFSFAYPISFIGACFYGIAAVVNIDPSTIITNKNVSVVINVTIGLCGILSLFAFLNITGNAPVIGPIILPNGNATIKQNSKSGTTY
jgi:hypothetical protein